MSKKAKILLILGILLLGAAIYFLYTWYMKKQALKDKQGRFSSPDSPNNTDNVQLVVKDKGTRFAEQIAVKDARFADYTDNKANRF